MLNSQLRVWVMLAIAAGFIFWMYTITNGGESTRNEVASPKPVPIPSMPSLSSSKQLRQCELEVSKLKVDLSNIDKKAKQQTLEIDTKTQKFENYKDGQEQGYLNTNNHMWWFDPSNQFAFTMFDLDGLYEDTYFASDHIKESIAALQYEVVEKVMPKIIGRKAESIVEFGSAAGWFTSYYHKRGMYIFGVEGTRAGIKRLIDRGFPQEQMKRHDLRLPLNLDRTFDLAICTEVGEHLEPPFASQLIVTIAIHSDVCLFSIEDSDKPNRNHVHHSNEQPWKYWDNLFAFYGFDGIIHLPANIVKGLDTRGNRFYYKTSVFGKKPDEY